jgi:L-alanine-DL-glutamate epimerase-like enolase superfamily enzyme
MIILDLSWCGGISEARKVGAMAATYHVPVAFHDCTGPVVLAASTHLALHTRNCWVQEIVRAFYYGWYHRFVTELPPLDNGNITVPAGPGLGTALKAEVLQRKDVHVRRTTRGDL